jgi:hypothetical protein
MKARIIIIVIYLFVGCYITAWANTGFNSFVNLNRDLDLRKYYKPYELNFEPNAPGYVLPLDTNDIINYKEFSSKKELANIQHLIQQNGFAIIGIPTGPSPLDDIVLLYKSLSSVGTPVFITTDTLLHIYHIQFEQILREIEKNKFTHDINQMTSALLNYNIELYDQLHGDLQEATRRNIAYLAVAQKLIEPTKSRIPELVKDVVTRELAKINAYRDFTSSDIFIYDEDYTQYRPRSYYFPDPQLQGYYKTMMWYGRMGFLLNGGRDFLISEQDAKIQTMQALLLVSSMEKVRIEEKTAFQTYEKNYNVISFFIGGPDDLTPGDYLSVIKKVFGENFKPKDLEDSNKFQVLKNELENLPSPKILSGIGDPAAKSLRENLEKTKGMHLMGQRFVPDSYMFQNLVYPRVGKYTGDSNIQPFTYGSSGIRCYPRGLDLMALLGSSEARRILTDEGDTNYLDYGERFRELKNGIDKLDQKSWNCNLYWSWLYSLKPLLNELPIGYPNFMRTSAWQKRSLNTALASWTELRHDTNLYAKMGGWPAGEILWPKSQPPPPGYVEPVPQFYGRLLALTQMTMRGLSDFQVISTNAANRLKALEGVLERLIAISIKELSNQKLTEEEYAYIKDFSTQLAPTISGVPPTDLTEYLVAGIHTFGPEGLVVEEGIGGFDRIYVVCSAPDGSIYIAVGPVFSYYEFKHPMVDRLNKEKWQYLLSSERPNKPERPRWYIPLMH